jgi:hypothetical protein
LSLPFGSLVDVGRAHILECASVGSSFGFVYFLHFLLPGLLEIGVEGLRGEVVGGGLEDVVLDFEFGGDGPEVVALGVVLLVLGLVDAPRPDCDDFAGAD